MIAEAELPQSEPVFFDAQFKQQNGGLVFDFRSHHIVTSDVVTVSDALWRFDAGDSISRRFLFDQVLDAITISLGGSKANTMMT